ncbi:E-selectin-like [Saccoglossus kowalevskii]|uniref:Uncharacterized protein LOC102800562 n=1 Tax=Saccoglossus kowalevskii TaxID=10224 RepID=A0ABM0LUJ2_SACKO|nr:PREDICTED: uncharacterized protein LOC102800562 [Saccoglossus kowalevskii]
MYSCEADIDCLDPGSPDNGYQVGVSSFVHGSTVEFKCDLGYELIGVSQLTCSNRKWDTELPQCQGQQKDGIMAFANSGGFVPDYYWDLSGKCSINDNDPTLCSFSCADGKVYSVVGDLNGELFTSQAALTEAPTNSPHRCAYQSNGDSVVNFGNFEGECLSRIADCPGTTKGISISVWLKINQALNTGERYYFSSGAHSRSGRGVALFSDSNSDIDLRFQVNEDAINFPWFVDIPFPDNVWFHAVFTFVQYTRLVAYIDGVEVARSETPDTSTFLLSWQYKCKSHYISLHCVNVLTL